GEQGGPCCFALSCGARWGGNSGVRVQGEPPRRVLVCGPIEGRGMLAGRTILIAEDEPLIRLDLTATLVGVGATVWPVADAREAYRLAAAPDITAAVLDYNLGANTSEFVGWRLHRYGVPFLFYTGRFDLPA